MRNGEQEPEDRTYNSAGTYGSESGVETVNNVVVNSQDVILRNMIIEGDLILGEGIGEGDVTLQNVEVKGQTIINGGGENSIYFEDSVVATVIVNKNNGKIRVVATGSTQVGEVVLESPAKLEERELTGDSVGFEDVTIGDSVQTVNDLQVEFIGDFETINSRASQVRINLPQGTSIRDIAINAVATILGEGAINTATVNADGTSIASRPQNVVLNVPSVSIRDEQVNESFSNSESTELEGINIQMGSIAIKTTDFVAGLSIDDFKVSATLEGEEYSLSGLGYNANTRTITFNPLSLDENTAGKTLKVTVEPSQNTEKLTGEAVSGEIAVQTGFSGRITDVQGVGIANVQINFRAGANSREGEVVATATTDTNGYYTVYVDPGQYTGEITGQGILRTYMYATSLSGAFNTNQNETAIRATAMDAVKIVLTWGEQPRDQDSHLEGPTSGEGTFHTWYGGKIHEEDGIRIVDLDWDDTQSYGPETTTIYSLVDGKYRFYVHNFSKDASLVGSDAKIEIYKGNETTPSEVFEIASEGENEEALYWVVFEMTVENENIVSIDAVDKLVGVRPMFEVNGQEYGRYWDNTVDVELSEESPLTISIPNAEDGKTYYSIDGGEEQLYTEPFQVTGPVTIKARSAGMDEYSISPKGDLENYLIVNDTSEEVLKELQYGGELALIDEIPSEVRNSEGEVIAPEIKNQENNFIENFSLETAGHGVYQFIYFADGYEELVVSVTVSEGEALNQE